jgi:hypothetical protein
MAKVYSRLWNFSKVTLRLTIITLVFLELLCQVLCPGKQACANLFGQEICLLPRPILSATQVDILDRLINDQTTYLQFEPVLGWSIRPNRRVEYQGAIYTSNDIGIRALRSYSLQTPEGITRIAAFGPSFTHGDEVSDEATWTYLLEQARPDLEVMNWGVGGYGTDQALLRYQTQGAAYAPAIVLIGYEDDNKFRNVNRFRPFYQSKTERPLTKPVFALQGEGLELLPNPFNSPAELREAILQDPNQFLDMICPTDYHCLKPGYQQLTLDRLKSFRLLRTLAFGMRHAQYEKARGAALVRSYAGPLSPPDEVTLRLLHAFVEEVRRNEAVPVVVIFPSSTSMMEYADGETPYYRTYVTRLRNEGIHVLDLTDAFAVTIRGKDVEFDTFVSPIGGHYNQAGNQLVSQAVLDYLLEAGIYPR